MPAKSLSMPTWVIVLCAALGGGLTVLLIAYLALRYFLRKFLTGLAAAGAPVRIQVVPKTDEQPWKNGKAVAEARRFFEGRDFQWVGDFALQPMLGAYASMLVNPDGVAAVVYDHAAVGMWVDVVLIYRERGGLTVSSVPLGGKLESPPFSHKHYLPKGTPQQVLELFQDKAQRVSQHERLPLTRDNIIKRFETAYADEMDWRNAQGGPSVEEIRSVTAESHPRAKDEEIQQTAALQATMANAALLEGLQDRFGQSMTADQHLRFRLEDLVFVHSRLTFEELQGYVESYVEDDEYEVMALPDACRGLAPLEAFAKLQTLLPEVVRFEKVGSLDFPLPTDVYRPPSGHIPIDIFPHRRRPDDEQDED
jgi:hypothetical protein